MKKFLFLVFCSLLFVSFLCSETFAVSKTVDKNIKTEMQNNEYSTYQNIQNQTINPSVKGEFGVPWASKTRFRRNNYGYGYHGGYNNYPQRNVYY